MADEVAHDEPIVIKFGLEEASAPQVARLRLSMILWGKPGDGKTTLASTAPGMKLWINFDPDGTDALFARAADKGDIIVLDLSGKNHTAASRMKEDNPYGIEKVLKDHPEIETVVLDSLTSFAEIATDNAVAGNKNSTHETPGQNGYTWRNALVRKCFVNVLRVTKKFDKHFIAICHEKEVYNTDGSVDEYTLSLSSSLIQQLCLMAGEVWNIRKTEKGERFAAVASCRKRAPMKTRMFKVGKVPEFQLTYDADTYEGVELADIYNEWKNGGGRKIDFPK